MFKTIRAVVVAALAATSLVAVSTPAQAVDATAFACTPDFYQASSGSFYHLDTNTLQYTQLGNATITSFNAIGWNPADNHIYGFSGGRNNTPNLYKINNDGSNDGGHAVSGTPSTTGGTFLGDNLMLTVGSGDFTTVDLTTSPATVSDFALGTSWSAADIAYYAAGNVAYGVDGTTLNIATFNQAKTSLTVSTKSLSFADVPNGTTTPGSGDAWGAAYVDGDGNGYFFDNDTAGLYLINAADLASANASLTAHWKVTATDSQGNLLSSPNDGASCPTAAAPAGIAPPSNNSSFTVTFDANGGSGSMSNQTGSSAAALTSNSFTQAGYTFTGWNTAANGSGTAYADGASYPFTSNVTLYAQWTANGPSSFTVTFNGNGGSGSMSNQSGSSAAALSSNSFSKIGANFAGWNTAANGSGTSYSNGASYPFNANVTLYAQWAPITFVVHYNSQGGSSVADGSFNYGGGLNLAGAPTRSGYTFGGWSLTPNGPAVSSPFTPQTGNDITFYAKWTEIVVTPPSYPLNFNPQGGSSVDGKNYKAGDCVALPAPTRDGYTFAGWATSSTGSAVANPYCPTGTGAITLYAQWTKNAVSHNVNFNSQGGSSVAGISFTEGGCFNLPAAPTRDGYTFNGWFSAETGGTAVTSPYCPTGAGDISLYAQWTKNAVAQRDPVKIVISGFADGSSKLTWTIKKKINNFLKKYSDYKYIECVGFTEGPTVLKTDKALSKARATVSCAYALAGLGQGLTAKPARAGNDTVEAAHLRRVEITLSDN